jgi:tRNA pseudouridine38-40 synthase
MRYFLELSYKGTNYAGFQVQANAATVQAEVERALATLYRREIGCTGSSRTDAGVHAHQNYFHFDYEGDIPEGHVYKLNAILPRDIAVRSVRGMHADAHCRFDAVSRRYTYMMYSRKDPFQDDRGWFYPYPLDGRVLAETAALVAGHGDFTAFAKRNSQVKTHQCRILESRWEEVPHGWAYRVRANRFLRGMVRGLVGTMVQAARGRMDAEGFRKVLLGSDNQAADFSAPGHGLFLEEVAFPDGYFTQE